MCGSAVIQHWRRTDFVPPPFAKVFRKTADISFNRYLVFELWRVLMRTSIKYRMVFYYVFLSVFIFIPLKTPTVFSSKPVAIKIDWNRINKPSVYDYKLFCRKQGEKYDFSKPIYEGFRTSFQMTGSKDTIYYFVVRSYSIDGIESKNSTEVETATQKMSNDPINLVIRPAGSVSGKFQKKLKFMLLRMLFSG